ncbi:pectinesterase family protein [Asticcacaulis sp. BYS171W]|uniref:Pectinesterase family protein n=1 Tax=Asticcacaulis aquaticus TaxID=2984212 RepID=A0ABT5HVS0_9CAUL|nr:pectinesterase family protein [Asticcacaulis aquaticus]MDC7684177.1 pectinesterase family protein [Asticcacaulis aquaticus]
MKRLFASLVLIACAVPAWAVELHVSKTEAGAYATVQAALDALPAEGGDLLIAPGTYREKLRVDKPHVRFIGKGMKPEDVVLVWGDSSINVGNTYNTPSTYVAADDFYAENLTFDNDWTRSGKPNSQAVALAVTGDRAVFIRVRILGAQDTLYLAHPEGKVVRHYFRDCYIEGHVDFIFGNAKAYFDRCQIHGIERPTIMYTAQSRNSRDEDSAFVFDHCRLTAYEGAKGNVWLGRAWRPYARVIFLDTQIDAPVDKSGWREWYPDRSKTLHTAYYAEYNSTGPGASPNTRQIFSYQLTAEQAQTWRLAAFFKGDTGWIPK